MFQTELNIFLQSFASGVLTTFFKFFTEIGKSAYAAPLVLIVMFGISFRMGFILLHVVSWNGLLTFCFKELFSLPRPSNVDKHVKLLGEVFPNPTTLESMGAKTFFGGFSRDTLDTIRTHPFDSWGFPSGHASHAVALWGSISLYMKKKWISLAAAMMIVFISLSRMYLGRHFLADVLGGLLLGLIVILVFYHGVYKNKPLYDSIFIWQSKIRISAKTILFYFYFLCVPFLVLLIPSVPMKQAAALLGLNIGFVLIKHLGIPKDDGTLWQRIGRVLVAIFLFFLFYGGLMRGVELVMSQEPAPLEFFRVVVSMFLSFWGSVEVCVRTGLYKR